MARIVHTQTNFTAGELSPRMKGRGDVVRYQNGAALIENGIVVVQGGVMRRPGTRYLATAKLGGARRVRLRRFVVDLDHAYLLELGHQYVRAYAAATGAALLDGAGDLLELASPYTEDQLPAITFRQAGDTLYMFHPAVAPHELRQLSATLWALRPVRFVVQPFAEIGHLPDAKLTIDNPAAGTGRVFTTTPVTPPDAPTGVVASALNGGARVSFPPPASNGAGIDRYEVTASPGGATVEAVGSPIAVPGLTNGVAYTFTVRAHNKAGWSVPSAPSNSVTPAAGLPGATITASVSPSPFSAEVENGPVILDGPTASGSGGVAPYTTTWRVLYGDPGVSVSSAVGDTARITSTGLTRTNYATLRATVKDAVGAQGTFDVNVSIKHRVPLGDRNPRA